jgi:hypothetical protein
MSNNGDVANAGGVAITMFGISAVLMKHGYSGVFSQGKCILT